MGTPIKSPMLAAKRPGGGPKAPAMKKAPTPPSMGAGPSMPFKKGGMAKCYAKGGMARGFGAAKASANKFKGSR